ncbi:hypothetical protein C2845_PM07G09580 [Panicum miliaceum]|uniref:Uncharacterized protein n=1 Tax=Panicum miliaceum TaxID=4540 RepID=A0A3L6SP46_PANMI|nr:hypothetical protein C2845_PM07G09580 [Panicum miliaceum]
MAKDGRRSNGKRNRTVTFNWPLLYFFYAHGGTLNIDDGSFVTTDSIREAANRLDAALNATVEGKLKHKGEEDELTYALETPEHTRCARGMGMVPWKHGFSADIETYRSRCRRKAEQEEKMRALEERLASIEGVLTASQRQQEAPSATNQESRPAGSQRRSIVASTEHPTDPFLGAASCPLCRAAVPFCLSTHPCLLRAPASLAAIGSHTAPAAPPAVPPPLPFLPPVHYSPLLSLVSCRPLTTSRQSSLLPLPLYWSARAAGAWDQRPSQRVGASGVLVSRNSGRTACWSSGHADEGEMRARQQAGPQRAGAAAAPAS